MACQTRLPSESWVQFPHSVMVLFTLRDVPSLGVIGFSCVSDGSRSVSEHSNIQSYLIDKFKFRKAYCRLDVYYKWWFGIVVKILYPFRNVIPFVNVKAVLRLEEYNRQQKSMFESKIGSL